MVTQELDRYPDYGDDGFAGAVPAYLRAPEEGDPELGTPDLTYRAQSYHDEVARTLLKMNNGKISVEAGTAQIMALSMTMRQQIGQGTGLVLPEERVRLVEEHFEAILRRDDTGAIRTGMPCLDRVLLGGLHPKQVTVVAGVPGAGKSVALQQFAEHAALEGRRVVFVAVEMDAVQLSYRTLARMTGIDGTRIRLGELSPRERDTVRAAIARLGEMSIAYKDGGDMSSTGIYEAVLEAQRELGSVDLIVADYLQILQDDKGAGNENMRLEAISRAMTNISKEFGCPVLVGSQINRESVKAGTRPHLHNLRGSGAIGQDATTVLLLHPDFDPDAGVEKMDEEKVTIIVEKNRNGRAGVDILCTFNQPCQFFREWHAKSQGEAGRGVVYTEEDDQSLLERGF